MTAKPRRVTQGIGVKLTDLSAAQQAKLFLAGLAADDLPAPVREWSFTPPRRWRFDYAWPDKRVALEIEGGVWTRGRHTRGSGFVKDMEKYNTAASLGWLIIRVQPSDLCSAKTLDFLRRALSWWEVA
jgi:hypothetical protein